MFSRFFIDRPILSIVLAIFIVLTGLAALISLPIEQYPNITPPQINVQATYPGANAQTVSDSVAAPLEQQINGVENMIYMYSTSASSGSYNLTVFFNIGSNVDIAQVNVQNQASLATAQLPEEVQKQGLVIKKQTPSILQVIEIYSPDGRYDDIFLSNYTTINIINDLLLLPGISQITIINDRDYAMRIWLNPDLLTKYNLSPGDISRAVQEQNAQYSVGQLGRPPNAEPLPMAITVTALGRLTTPEEFDDIIVKSNPDGSTVRIRDVGHTELGAKNYDVNGQTNKHTSILVAVYQQFGANALDVAESVNKKMVELSNRFPEGIASSVPYDTTIFVKASISEVIKTIFEAGLLVILVVFIFLQNWRLTLIPVIAMAVSIIGTFVGMLALGFSLNTLTLFGMVLAIGIVVDDAIVVVENIERNMRTYHLSAKEAAYKAMGEVFAPIIAIVFVLCAVFLPVAFLGGIAGQLYKQFAITISISVVISGIVALTLSPALAALLITEHKENRFTRAFNNGFEKLNNVYSSGARFVLENAWLGLGLFAAVLAGTGFLLKTIPTSFVPNEDQGYLFAIAVLPEGDSLSRTQKVSDQLQDIALKNPAVENIISMTGFSYLDGLNLANYGTYFIILKDWSKRTQPSEQAEAVLNQLRKEFNTITDAQILSFNPPAIQGLGTVGGFEMFIENRGDGPYSTVDNITKEFIKKGDEQPELANLVSTINANAKQLYLDVDRTKARALGVPIGELYSTLQTLFGSYYVNNFNKYGRVYQVLLQADSNYRKDPKSIERVYVPSNQKDQMVPLQSLLKVVNTRGPNVVYRFNSFVASKVNGGSAPGYSSGQSLQAVDRVAKEILPNDMQYSFDGEAYQEIKTGGSSSFMLIAGMVMVFLILAGLYERWTLPFAIILAVPFGILGALFSIWILGRSNDVYFQIGLVTLIALAAKNAILIVEFAVDRHREGGLSFGEAALEAGRVRLRAILMTSLTFIFGVIPLVLSTGAGANSRHSVGTGVLGGMIFATFFAIFFVPLFFKLIEEFSAKWTKPTTSELPKPKEETHD